MRPARPGPVDRLSLIARMRAQLEASAWPRVELSLIIGLSGIAAFLISFLLLRAGVDSMSLRYGLAGAAGYLTFLGLIAVWIAWKRHGFEPDFDVDAGHVFDAIDAGTRFSSGDRPPLFVGGRSGGGGASGSWIDGRTGGGGGGGSSWADDLGDSIGLVIVIIAAVIGGLLAIGYVVYLAPVLFAEVLVDAVIIAAISKRVARADRRDWTATVLRRTWFPALMLIAMLVAGGWALQKLAPDARSIGPAIETFRR